MRRALKLIRAKVKTAVDSASVDFNPSELGARLEGIAIELESLGRNLSGVGVDRIQITLGRSDSIARFFAFNFVHRPRKPLSSLDAGKFVGAGVYALYYIGESEPAYEGISRSETPIYLGKADPRHPYAESPNEQGAVLHRRLGEHAKSIRATDLPIDDFEFRYATIQSGMQAAVEEFLIRLFRPIWNKETKVCHGIGKHGDSAATRGNKRSPWDTMHPGRKWAAETSHDQSPRAKIVDGIQEHFKKHPPLPDLDALRGELLADR